MGKQFVIARGRPHAVSLFRCLGWVVGKRCRNDRKVGHSLCRNILWGRNAAFLRIAANVAGAPQLPSTPFICRLAGPRAMKRTSEKRTSQKILGFLSALATLGAVAILLFLATQLVALIIAIGVGIIVALWSDIVYGIVAGIFAYGIVMKLFWYFDIFEMITLGEKAKRPADEKSSPKE